MLFRSPAVFQTRDYAWLEERQRAAETSAGAARPAELTLGIQGISCAGCVWLIERVHQELPGAGEIVVNPQYGTLRLRWWPGEFAAPEFARRLQGLGYLAGPPEEQAGELETRGLLRRMTTRPTSCRRWWRWAIATRRRPQRSSRCRPMWA